MREDIYYNEYYGKLYEGEENGEYVKFAFSSNVGLVIHPFIKRPLPWLIDGKQYFDIVTPYGYGGPLIEMLTGNKQELMMRFGRAFKTYCETNEIVSEFIRFHTLYENALYCGKIYKVLNNRKTVAVDLKDVHFFDTQFESDCRRMVRKAEKNGVKIEIDRRLESIEVFENLYYCTMAKNCASDYYYFSDKYFSMIKEGLYGSAILINAVYAGDIIASSLFFYTAEGYAHHHLSATRPEYYKLAANNLIIKAACEELQRDGCTWLHLGGGLRPTPDDPVFAFKHSFGREEKNLKSFYIGKKIWNSNIYNRALELRHLEVNEIVDLSFFPLYRV